MESSETFPSFLTRFDLDSSWCLSLRFFRFLPVSQAFLSLLSGVLLTSSTMQRVLSDNVEHSISLLEESDRGDAGTPLLRFDSELSVRIFKPLTEGGRGLEGLFIFPEESSDEWLDEEFVIL